jgi:hypothetical protein
MAVKYRLFLDECGDHGLVVVNPDFPVFVLCGVIMSEEAYLMVDTKIAEIKRAFWGDKKVILHSRDIRKCDREFQVLFDPDIKKSFYEAINHVVGSSHYTIIAAAINKEAHIKQYGKLASDVNGLQLSDLIAYPVARHVLDPIRANPAFDVLVGKFYSKGGKRYGLKVFP